MAWMAAVTTAEASPPATPFTLMEGTEVARTAPLRDLAWHVLGYTLDGGRLLGVRPEGAALLDERGEPQARLDCPQSDGTLATDVSVAGDGSVVAARYTNGRVCTWGYDGTQLGAVGKDVTVAAAGHAKMVVLGHADGRLEGRDPRTGGRRWTRNPALGPIVHLRYEAKGPRVAASTGTQGVAVVDTRSGRLVRGLRGPPAYAAAFDRTGATLAVGRANGRVEIWDTAQWYARKTLKLSPGNVVDVDFSGDGKQVAAAIERGAGADRAVTLEVWDFDREEIVFREPAPAGPGPTRFRFDSLGERVVAGNGPGASRVWGRPGARPLPRPLPSDEPPHQRPFFDPLVLPAVSVVAPTEVVPGAIATSERGGRILLRVPASSAPAPASPLPVAPATKAPGVPATAKTPAAPAAPPLPPGLAVLDRASGLSVPLSASAEAAAPVVLSPDGSRVAAWVDERLSVWDASTGAVLARVAVARPRALALDARRLVVATEEGKVYAGTLERLRAVPDARDVTAVALDPFHPDRLGVGTADGGVRIVDARTGASLGAWGVHAGALSALAFSDDGRLLATAGPRPAATGARLVVLGTDRAEEGEPWSAVLDALPTRLAFDGTTRVLALAPGAISVIERGGAVLDLSVNVVDARFDGERVQWIDTAGALRPATLGPVLPPLPRGRLFARSDDGRFAVTVDGDRIAVWDDRIGRLLRELPATGQQVVRCQFADAGDRLAVLYADASIEVYEVATGEALRNLEGPPPSADPWLRFSEDGALLWTFTGPRTLAAWEIATGTARERVTLPGEGDLALDAATQRLRFVRFAGPGGDAWVDTHATSPRRVTLPADGFRPLAVGPRARWILAAADGALVRVDPETGRRVGAPFESPGDPVGVAGAVSPDGKWIAASYQSGLLRVWEVERGLLVASLGADARQATRGPPQPVASLAFDDVGEVVTARDATGYPRLFEWSVEQEAPAIGVGAGPVLPSTDVTALAVSPDGAVLFSAHGDANARSWDLATGVQTNFYWGHAARVTTLAVAAGGSRLLTGSEDGSVRAWDTAVAVERVALDAFGDAVRRLAASGDGWTAAAVGDGNVLRTWDVARGKGVRRWSVQGGLPTNLALGPVGGVVTVTMPDGGTWALDPATGNAGPSAGPGPLPGGPPPVEDPDVAAVRDIAAALAPITADARAPGMLITAGADGRIRVWDLATRSQRLVLRAMTDGSWVLDRADGTRYASESLRDGSSPLLARPQAR